MTATHFTGPVVSENGFQVGSGGGFQSGAGSVKDITGATTLVAADSGKLMSLNAAAGAAITLPAVTNTGWSARFVVSTAFATTDWVISSAEGDNIEGCFNIANTLTSVDAADSFTFELGAENIGDFVDVVSDGTSWLVYGVGLTALSLSSTG